MERLSFGEPILASPPLFIVAGVEVFGGDRAGERVHVIGVKRARLFAPIAQPHRGPDYPACELLFGLDIFAWRPPERDIAVTEADYFVEVEIEIYGHRHSLSRRRSLPRPHVGGAVLMALITACSFSIAPLKSPRYGRLGRAQACR